MSYPPTHIKNGIRDQSINWAPNNMWPGDLGTSIVRKSENSVILRRIRCKLDGSLFVFRVLEKTKHLRSDYSAIAGTRVIYEEE